MQLLDGKKLAKELLAEYKNQVETERIRAVLAVIQVGRDSASTVFVKKKREKCEAVGIGFRLIELPGDIKLNDLEEIVKKLNEDEEITGILIQLPLPPHLPRETVVNRIAPEKDVDGLTTISRERLKSGEKALVCATARGILTLLEKNGLQLVDQKIVIVGAGYLVGQPLALILKSRGIDFTLCNSKTENRKNITRTADILITATGVPNLITADDIKPGAAVVDAGTAELNGRLSGDVDFNFVKEKAAWITPVPGGVGPMTIASLIGNIIEAYYWQNSVKC